MRLTRQCFHISRELSHSFSLEEINATYVDMEEMGIAYLPYPDLDIISPASAIFKLRGYDKADHGAIETYETMLIKLRYTGGLGSEWYAKIPSGRWIPISEDFEVFMRMRREHSEIARDIEGFTGNNRDYVLSIWRRLLIVALATRNIIKEVREHKAAQLGIGKGEYAATTTLKLGTITESQFEGHGGTHASPRPHLRRGHIRRQHYGPLNELVKKIWVAPTMVNVDQEFVDRRTAYNVSP